MKEQIIIDDGIEVFYVFFVLFNFEVLIELSVLMLLLLIYIVFNNMSMV